ncbi:MAG: hypothetical protein M1816_004188 [Peltula sp. TS41687]|nr:MAG: hypothetical protein M1816_004188 [Peltula sp. TS41687]
MRFHQLSVAAILVVKAWALPRPPDQKRGIVNTLSPPQSLIDTHVVASVSAPAAPGGPAGGVSDDVLEPVMRKMPRRMTEDQKRKAREQAYMDQEGWEAYTTCLYGCLGIPEGATSFSYEAEQHNHCVTQCGKGEEFFVSEGFSLGERPPEAYQTIDVPYEVVKEDDSSTQGVHIPANDAHHKQADDQSWSWKQGVSDRLRNFAANIQRVGAAGLKGGQQSRQDWTIPGVPKLAALPVGNLWPSIL